MEVSDLVVVGGGINGVGIARDAAGRGLSVLLLERGDLANATSSASSKLIHGGLRYLEHYEFRLVAEALAERETLLRVAGHLAWPARFIVPHVPGLRPRWMIRAGLFLYDHLARRSVLPGSRAVRLDRPPYRAGLNGELRHGFAYSDCRVDDARLVIANAGDAAARGARILVRTECRGARRENGRWRVSLSGGREVHARAIVNAAGPWTKQVLNERLGQASHDELRLVRGSHAVFPRLYEGEHIFILQNDDGRVVFMIPYEGRFTLVGTTDVQVDSPDARPSDEEIRYLCRAVSRYLARPVGPEEALWTYAGVRPLYDDGSRDPSAVTRDYTLRLDGAAGEAPVLSVFGGKITTYRRLAEQVLERLRRYFPGMPGEWTSRVPLPGSGFDDREAAQKRFYERHAGVPREWLRDVFRRHGVLSERIVGGGAMGEHFGAGLTEREVHYFMEHEWATSADDVLWRRTKCGLHMNEAQRRRVEQVIGR